MGRAGVVAVPGGMTGRRALALSAVFALVVGLAVVQLQTTANSATTGTTTLISRFSNNPPNVPGAPGFGVTPSLSADGRYTAFVSTTNLDPFDAKQNPNGNPDTTGRAQVYLRDRVAGTTRWVSEHPEMYSARAISSIPVRRTPAVYLGQRAIRGVYHPAGNRGQRSQPTRSDL